MGNLEMETCFKYKRCRIKAELNYIDSGSLSYSLYHNNLAHFRREPVRAMLVSLMSWHDRLAHVDQADINRIIDHVLVNGAALNSRESINKSFN